jgi:mRNA interferase HigB
VLTYENALSIARKAALQDWYSQAADADWTQPADVKQQYGDASILRKGRVVFNISGNKYRLVVWINYPYRVIYIRFVGTHAKYDDIDAETI